MPTHDSEEYVLVVGIIKSMNGANWEHECQAQHVQKGPAFGPLLTPCYILEQVI